MLSADPSGALLFDQSSCRLFKIAPQQLRSALGFVVTDDYREAHACVSGSTGDNRHSLSWLD